jgi:hypothetical protein
MSIEPVYIGTPDKGEKQVLIPAYIPLIKTSFSTGQGLRQFKEISSEGK